jgi:two-component system, OmpR family, sensor histidine kinase MprB
MSFRRRIAIAAAAAVAIAVVLVSLLTYLLTSNQLRGQVDSQLRNRGREADRLLAFLRSEGVRTVNGREAFGLAFAEPPRVAGGSAGGGPAKTSSGARGSSNPFGNLPPGPGQVRGYQQVVGVGGAILLRSARGVTLPVDAATKQLAANGGRPFFRDADVQGLHLRVLAEPLGPGRALQLAQPLTEVDSLLARLRLILVLLDGGAIALAALLGLLVAGAAVGPLRRLSQATEHVALTQDLSGRIEPVSEDELGRLAKNFNAMLDALERSMGALDASVHAQRQLVADASHELRTPVTSLRTNVEILQQTPDMDPAERQWMLSEVVDQIEELTLLMNDLIDLARGDEPGMDSEDVRLDLVVSEVVERARKRAPGTPILLELEPTIVAGLPARLERAISNLVDNAIKYSAPGEPVEISLQAKELTVRDHGPGISAEDLPHVFDRFYRGADARGRPGSGLGLAIVRQVVDQQGGSVVAEPAPGGGTLMRMRLPGAESLRPAGVAERTVAENGGRESEAAAERAREVRRLPVADQAGDVLDRDRPLLDEQLGRR